MADALPAPDGEYSVAEFMSRFWQQAPCLIRGAIPDLCCFTDREQLITIAQNNHINARLVLAKNGAYPGRCHRERLRKPYYRDLAGHTGRY